MVLILGWSYFWGGLISGVVLIQGFAVFPTYTLLQTILKHRDVIFAFPASLRLGGVPVSYDTHCVVVGDAAGMIDPMTGTVLSNSVQYTSRSSKQMGY